jgi:hypothetical protein
MTGESSNLEEEWKRVVAEWGDPKAHTRFLALAEASGELAFAGRRYRELRESDPSKAAEAQRAIDEILSRAMSRMTLERTPVRTGRTRAEWIGMGVALAFLIGMALAVAQAFTRR